MTKLALLLALAFIAPVAAQTLQRPTDEITDANIGGNATQRVMAEAKRLKADGEKGTLIPNTTSAPRPSSVTTGTSTPTAGSIPSPSLTGLTPISTGVDVAKHLSPAWATGQIPPVEEAEGAFRFICGPSHNSYNDPIVYPGQPGKSHLHTFFGNTKADAYSTYESLRKTGESTCGNILNRSAYWVPAMLNGHGQVVMPDFISIYYKSIPRSDPSCQGVAIDCIKLPDGLRYIFGYNMQNPAASSPSADMWWACDAADKSGPGDNGYGHYPNIATAAYVCPVGAHIGMELTGPSCWNGTELDSADHRSHLAYPRQEGCPATHPYLLPHFTIAVWWTVDATLDRSGNQSPNANTWYLSSDRMPGMANAVPGTTLHSDWFGAWEDSIMETWMTNCINKSLNCSGGDLGNGKQITQAWQPKYGWANPNHLLPVPTS